MGFNTPSFWQIREQILQEIRNLTGITTPDDSDAAIRADGEASVVEGLYQHQKHIERQLFTATADEPYLYLHAEKIGLPRLGGTRASGTVIAISNVDLSISNTAKVTDGRGYYWSVTGSVSLTANQPKTITILADQAGSSWNFNGASLRWIAPEAGLQGAVTVVDSIVGGSDQEELEDWRSRLIERQQLGFSRGRAADIQSIVKTVAGVRDVYVYPKRRGLGSLDVAITATGNPPTLPSVALLNDVQVVLEEHAGFWADVKAYAPTIHPLNVSAVVSGSADLLEVEGVIRSYMGQLAPSSIYQPAVLTALIFDVAGVTDLQLTPSINVIPELTWMRTGWVQLNTLSVTSI